MMQPPVVVVMATRNRPELLATRSVPSILSQTVLPTAVIVVDDSDEPACAKQNHSVLSELLPDPSPELLYQRTPGGQGAAASWNAAVRIAQERWGDCWVAMLDDDDAWKHNHVASCLDAAKGNRATAVISGIDVTAPTGTFLQPIPGSLEVAGFLRGNPGWQGSNTFMRLRHFMEVGGFDEDMPSTLDRDLAVRVLQRGAARWAFTKTHSVEYYIEPERSALSNAGSKVKLQGLSHFYRKHVSAMSIEDQRHFFERAERLFGGTPEWALGLLGVKESQGLTQAVCGPERLEAAKQTAARALVAREVQLLGFGKEGVVLSDGETVCKVFDGWRERPSDVVASMQSNVAHLLALRPGPQWLPLEARLSHVDGQTVLLYRFEESVPYQGDCRPQMVQMVRDLLVAGTMYLGFRLSSFRVVGADTVRLVDLGCDVIPLLPSALRHNLERAFLVVEHGGRSDLPVLFWRAFNGEPLPELEGFEQFYRECTR